MLPRKPSSPGTFSFHIGGIYATRQQIEELFNHEVVQEFWAEVVKLPRVANEWLNPKYDEEREQRMDDYERNISRFRKGSKGGGPAKRDLSSGPGSDCSGGGGGGGSGGGSGNKKPDKGAETEAEDEDENADDAPARRRSRKQK